ncbi:MAG: RimK family alpha-L-glutamate ligase [Gemmatimonadetes bacterium]|nr:RimK family alpha-L-glutamate ligase [Gemmatimonadota bacterium]
MNVAILAGCRGWHTDALERALAVRGLESAVLPVDALVGRTGCAPRLAAGGRALDEVHGVLVRTIPRGSLDQIIFRVDALHRLERLGVPVVNPPGTIERTVDKYYTSTLLEDAGIPTPATVVAERLDDAMAAFRSFGDAIVKPLFGSNGRGMVRVEDEEIAYRVFRALELDRAIYYIQKTIPHDGCDVRAFVVGGRVVAAATRRATGWRTNISRGGVAERVELPQEWEALSLRAAAAVGAEYAGVDLLPARSGELYVLEVNGSPGWRGLQSTTRVDIAGAIVDHLAARMASPREA